MSKLRSRSYADLDAVQKSHMMRVHGLVGVGLVCAAAGAKIHMDATVPGSDTKGSWLQGGDHMTVVQVLCIVYLGLGELGARTRKSISPLRALVYLVCAFAAGLNIGTWIYKAAQENGLCAGQGWTILPDIDMLSTFKGNQCQLFEEVLYSALVLTAGAYACFFVAATMAPKGSAQQFAPFVLCGMYILSITYWASRIFGWMDKSGFDLIYVQGGLALYCLKVFVDTREIYDRVADGERDVVSHALKVFLNICHLFIRIITILAKIAAAKAKKR